MFARRNQDGATKTTRMLFDFVSYGLVDDYGHFSVSFNYNTESDMVVAKEPITLKTKLVHDGIGMFSGDWLKDPWLNFKVKEDV